MPSVFRKLSGVAPYVGAWIEILSYYEFLCKMCHVAPYVGAWIEIRETGFPDDAAESPLT